MGLRDSFGGLNVAITTPFTEKGQLDVLLFETHIHQLICRGVQGIVYLGTTGEGAYFAPDRTKELYASLLNTRKLFPKVGLICGFVKPTMEDILVQAEQVYEDTTDAFLVAPPFDEFTTETTVIGLFKRMAQFEKLCYP